MHVHTTHSGMCTVPGLRKICRESYTDPEALYAILKRRGMDFVTVTDHNSIDAVEALRRYPDFFLSEEVTSILPAGTECHIGIYNITEQQHQEIQRRRTDFLSLHAYLLEQSLLFSANHIFSSLTGRRTANDFEYFQQAFPAFETRNGCMPERNNRACSRLANALGKAPLAGSDAHAVFSLGSCWTEVPEARTKEEFLAGVRLGLAHIHGTSGNYWRLTRDVLSIGASMFREHPTRLPFALLAPLAPVVTLINYGIERRFVNRWAPRVLAGHDQEQNVLNTISEEVAA